MNLHTLSTDTKKWVIYTSRIAAREVLLSGNRSISLTVAVALSLTLCLSFLQADTQNSA